MLLTKTVIMKWSTNNREWYESKGYVFTKWKDEFEVKVEDLTDGCSSVKVDIQCDECGEIIKNIVWASYKMHVKKDGKWYCRDCSRRLFGKEKELKTRLKNGKNSFGYWLIKNLPLKQAISIIVRWDDKKNKKDIREISYSSNGLNNKGYWFKCPEDIHPSELKRIGDFTRGHDKCLDCTVCNSIGQYLLNTYGTNGLHDYWDYEKNNKLGLDPFNISKGSNKIKVWIFCQEKSYHGSYLVVCNNFTNGSRCPYCTNKTGEVHPLDSLGQYIINNYGQEFLDKIWSKKNKKSAFEYSPNSTQKAWFKCLDGKHEDYKRSVGNSNKYNFRCAKCVGEMDESIIQNKTRLYLEKLGFNVLCEYDCTIIPINPKTKYQLPFDNEIILANNIHLVCEVNGIQHYQLSGFHQQQAKTKGTTPEEEFHYQKLKDRYKKFITYKNGYKFLEIPCWTDDNEETYKKLIDDKIEEILNSNSNNIDIKVS